MFCGIDLGTSSVKASVFDEHGRQLAFSRREIDLVLPQTGLAELDPENYLVKVYETLCIDCTSSDGTYGRIDGS